MIKKFRVSVDGHAYDVMVELPEDAGALPAAQPAAAAPAAPVAVPAPAAPPAPAASAAPKAAAGPGAVPSPLAGRVTAVVVKAGQEVKEGDHLLTLDAMKMNTFVFAPKTGKVAEIKAAVGDAVEEGQALMVLQ